MIDTHTHFNSTDLKDLKEEIKKVRQMSYLDKVINVGLDEKTNKEVVAISLKEDKFYASLGIHPLNEGSISSILKLYERLDCHKVVALGETGLDGTDLKSLEQQKEKFIKTIQLANELQLPIIIHSNHTNREVMDILEKHVPKEGFVFHCFQPDLEILDKIIKKGGYISVGTPITRPTAKKSLEVIQNVPIENLLIELDYPYMSAQPTQDGRAVFNKIKSIRDYSHKELENIFDQNAKRLFKRLDN